jgi:ABC-type uncharacterized transport system permease subunit
MELFASIIATTLRLSVPVMLAAIGCSFSTKAGVTAFGCEGMMAAGAIFATIGAYYSGNRWVGVFVGLVAGLFMSLIHGVLHIRFRVNATLSGMGVNLLGVATATLLLKLVWNEEGFSPPTDAFSKLSATPPFTGIAKIPLIGGVLGEQSIYLLFCIVFIILGWVYMYRTTFGLRMRMVGENPVAAHSVGINTVRYKYFGVIMCGLLAGLGGTYLSLVGMNRYTINMAAGRGYVAMVINNLGGSNPIGTALSSLFFGFFDCLQFVFQGVQTPAQLMMMMPYVFTLIVCLLNSKRATGPAGVGKHFDAK